MQKQAISRGNHSTPTPLHQVMHAGAQAFTVARHGATRVASGTGQLVRQHPFAAVGVALGSGIALGVLAHWLFAPGHPDA